jgi:hypothetical protein
VWTWQAPDANNAKKNLQIKALATD